MATSKRPRKKYDAQAHLKQPISASEHAGNVNLLLTLRQKLQANSLTFREFDKLCILHRATFYDKFSDTDIDVTNIRGIIERIFNTDIVPNTRWDEPTQTYMSDLSKPLKIHNVRREYLISFIEHHIQVLVDSTDRRAYAQMLYHGMQEHLIYCNLQKQLGKCNLIDFMDKADDAKTMECYLAAAKKFNVQQLRSL